jgi:hypothetical protein
MREEKRAHFFSSPARDVTLPLKMLRLNSVQRTTSELLSLDILPYCCTDRNGMFTYPPPAFAKSVVAAASSSSSSSSKGTTTATATTTTTTTTVTTSSIVEFDIVICTCTLAAMLQGLGVPTGHFQHIFIDEAAQVILTPNPNP